MELSERKAQRVLLNESFTVDLHHVQPDEPDEAVRYGVGLCADGSIQQMPGMRIGFSEDLIGAVVAFYPDHGGLAHVWWARERDR